MWPRPFCLALASLCLLVGLAGSASPQDHCDPGLIKRPEDPSGYGPRGDRCEGLFVREVAGSAGLRIASLTEPFEHFEITPDTRLHVQWTPPESAPVRLRASALRRRLYYRMDTLRPSGAKSYVWPANMLASFNLGTREIGIVGWTPLSIQGRKHDVYVPLRVARQTVATHSGNYVLVLVPGADLNEVYISLGAVQPDGRIGAFVKRDEPLGYGYYPAERAFSVRLAKPRTAGIYRMDIGATLRQGGSATQSLLFYHPAG
jgi:hypothetical protein